MKSIRRWAFLILAVSALLLSACAKAPPSKAKEQPSRLETMTGTSIKRVVLTDKALQRINIQTTTVQNGVSLRTKRVAGLLVLRPTPNPAVVAITPTPAGGINKTNPGNGGTLIQVDFPKNDLSMIDTRNSKHVWFIDQADDNELEAEEVELEEPTDVENADDEIQTVYYILKEPTSGGHNLLPGRRVVLDFAYRDNGVKRIVIPYAAVIYDQKGETWVYTNPEPRVFVRRQIVVDYIEGDLAYLVVGPANGEKIVTVGAAELYGAETGVSK